MVKELQSVQLRCISMLTRLAQRQESGGRVFRLLGRQAGRQAGRQSGLADVRVYFLPEPRERKVRVYFDAAVARYGTPWPIRYRGKRG